jgi:putative (di)nucleoside polyphosphate hydrolase
VRITIANTYIVHKITKTTKIKKVAKLYKIPVADILDINPSLGSKLYAGQTVKIPVGNKASIAGETPEETLFRELEEEVGLRREHVEIVASTEGWLTYRLPRRFLRRPRNRPHCIGQRQKWFLLRLTAEEEAIDLFASESPEFKAWRWVNYWYPIRKVVHFKRGVYARALRELAPALKGERGEQDRKPISPGDNPNA